MDQILQTCIDGIPVGRTLHSSLNKLSSFSTAVELYYTDAVTALTSAKLPYQVSFGIRSATDIMLANRYVLKNVG